MSEEQIKTLPLNGRNFVNLTRTVPGVVRGVPGANIDGAGSLAWRASASFSANGQRPRDNNYMLDGVDNNETWLQTVVLFPSVDALDEFKLQTSTYSAEFGRSLGGVVNLQIKSGANKHARQRLRVPAQLEVRREQLLQRPGRAARSRTSASTSTAAPSAARSSRTRRSTSSTTRATTSTRARRYLSTVPSAKMRAGDFSELNRVIYDPMTHLPFPGNIIPADRWDPAAKNILEPVDSRAEHGGHAQCHRADHQQLPDQPDAGARRTTRST